VREAEPGRGVLVRRRRRSHRSRHREACREGPADPRLVKTAEALAIAQTPWTFHFNDMSNDNASPWIEMVRTAVFEGDIDGAIARAKKRMKQIQCN